jgi:hypothetical protein
MASSGPQSAAQGLDAFKIQISYITVTKARKPS